MTASPAIVSALTALQGLLDTAATTIGTTISVSINADVTHTAPFIAIVVTPSSTDITTAAATLQALLDAVAAGDSTVSVLTQTIAGYPGPVIAVNVITPAIAVAPPGPSGPVAAGTYRSLTVDMNGVVTAGTNPTTLAGYSITDAVADALGTPSITADVIANQPAAGTRGRLFLATDTKAWYRDNGATWDVIGTALINQAAMMIGGPGGSALTAGTYYFTPGASRPMTILSALVYVIGSGTATVAIQIAGVSVTSLSALAATTSSTSTTNATGANTVVAGNTITVVVSAASVAPGSALLVAFNYVG